MDALRTERLLLDPLARDHFAPLVELYARPEVMRYIEPGGRSEATTRAFLERLMAQAERLGFGGWVVQEKASGALAGNALLIERTPGATIELGYILDQPFWRRGYATEACAALVAHAFGPLDLPQLIAVVDEPNVGSIQVLHKLGMRQTLRAERPSGGVELRFALERIREA